MWQGIYMKLTMKYQRYKNEKSIESVREYISPETRMYWAPEQSTGQILGWMNHFWLLFVFLTNSLDRSFISIQLKDLFTTFVCSSNNKQKLFICQVICQWIRSSAQLSVVWGVWNWQWNTQGTRMKNPLKPPGNRYEIDNEIPKVQEWKIHWKHQGIYIKLTMKYPRYKNEKSIETAREYIWN